MDFEGLYDVAKSVVNPRVLSDSAEAGGVGCALLTDKGNVYTGVCIDADCSVGFCAEHAAIAAMVTAGENRILKIIAVGSKGNIMPPCGRCREFISQVDKENLKTLVLVADDTVMTIKDLLPFDWKEK